MNGLQLPGKWVEWEGKQAVATWLYALVHNVLMGFYSAHKRTLCKVACDGEGAAFYGTPRCNCFFLQLP